MNVLNGYNYSDYLKRKLMVGQIDPWRRTDEGKNLYTLLVSVQAAMDECKEWSSTEINRKEFVDYLKLNDILVFNNVEDFVKAKENNPKIKRADKRKEISVEVREKRRLQMLKINDNKRNQENGANAKSPH